MIEGKKEEEKKTRKMVEISKKMKKGQWKHKSYDCQNGYF